MKRLGILAALAVLAGCGGPSQHSHVKVARLAVAPGHVCTPQNTAMQCVLAEQPHPGLLLKPGGARTILGWDFAWACPDPQGKAFGWSYLSPDASKNWTVACIGKYHSQHAATVAGWESTATRTTDGGSWNGNFNNGFADAQRASAQLAGLGAPAGQPFTMAIDFDASGPEVAAYFYGAGRAEPGRINAYGGYRPLLYLYQHHLVGHLNFQAYAWSGGRWLPASIAPLEQYLNSSAVDYDRAIAPYYGQWPLPAPALPVKQWVAARGKSLHAYYQHGCSRPVLTSGTCGQLAWRVDHFQKLIDKAHGYYPRCFGQHADAKAAECQIVRSAVAVWSRARASTDRAGVQNNCGGIATWGRPSSSRACRSLAQRETYFGRRIDHTLATSRY